MTMEQISLPPPVVDQAYFHVSALEAGTIYLPINMIIADAGDQVVSCPSLAFLLRHSKTGYQIVFDLGTRRDFEGYPPAMQKRIRTLGLSFTVTQTVDESLIKGGVAPDAVDAVILSHLHWDHAGDHTPFIRAEFIVGEGCRDLLRNGYPEHPDGYFSSTTVPVERTRFVSTAEMAPLGPYPHALDLFGDASLFIVDAPGHVAGHINVLARTSAHSWILLAGDSAHDPRIVTGEKAFARTVDAAGVERYIMHADKDVAEQNLERVRALQRANVQVLIAHDAVWSAANEGAFLPGVIAPLA